MNFVHHTRHRTSNCVVTESNVKASEKLFSVLFKQATVCADLKSIYLLFQQ